MRRPPAHEVFDANNPDLEVARRIALEWLRFNPGAQQIPEVEAVLTHFVKFAGVENTILLGQLLRTAFWHLVLDRIIVSGQREGKGSSSCFPWFHLTEYGRTVLNSEGFNPYDPERFLTRMGERVGTPDPTVIAYVAESLKALRAGLAISSALTLGIAAERVFLLLTESLHGALRSPAEKTELAKLLITNSMKRKLDFVSSKLDEVSKLGTLQRPDGWPDTAALTANFIYNLLRIQRNDLGHPQPLPPKMSTEDAFVNLQIFPVYYQHVEELRLVLSRHQV